MSPDDREVTTEPTREEVEMMPGAVVLEFGARWCGYCRALAPQLAAFLGKYPQVRHVRVEDGPGQPLGRSFGVKLWPTLIFLRDGRVISRAVRPELSEVREGFDAVVSGADEGQTSSP